MGALRCRLGDCMGLVRLDTEGMVSWLRPLLTLALVGALTVCDDCGGSSSTDSARAYFKALMPIERGYEANSPEVRRAVADIHAEGPAGDWVGPAERLMGTQKRMELLSARAAAITPPSTLRFAHRDFVASLRAVARYDEDLYRAASESPETVAAAKRSLDVMTACRGMFTGYPMRVMF